MKAIRHFILFAFLLAVPVFSFAQQISNPAFTSTDASSTKLIAVNVNHDYTVLTFEHAGTKGEWIQVNKSMYLQDADDEEKYEFVKAENIPLRPAKYTFDKNESLIFKVYFKKLKPETKEINVIERALSPQERNGSATYYFNYYGVSLIHSQTDISHKVQEEKVEFTPPRPEEMMSRMFTQVLTAQLQFYSKPETTELLAKIQKNYFDALIKSGFSEAQALKIVSTAPLLSNMGSR